MSKLESKALNTLPSSRPWFAAQDVERLNEKWRPTYTPKQRSEAQKVADILDSAYHYKGLHINYRERFISVKVDRPYRKDTAMIAEAEALFADKGYVKRVSAQGVIYRLPR